jgi:hypothetical protein
MGIRSFECCRNRIGGIESYHLLAARLRDYVVLSTFSWMADRFAYHSRVKAVAHFIRGITTPLKPMQFLVKPMQGLERSYDTTMWITSLVVFS